MHGVANSWVRIQDTYVAEAYNALVAAARKEAGRAMTEAWKIKPIMSDEDMPLGVGLRFPEMEQKRVEYINVVHWRLQWPPLRWVREIVIPYVFGLLNKTGSNRT